MSDLKHEVIAGRWAALIKERTDSGMTIKEWCQERNIKESQYYYWLKTLWKEETGNGELEQQPSPFVELPVYRSGRVRICGVSFKSHGSTGLCSVM